MISPKLFITTTSSIGVAFAVSLGLSHGVVDLHHLRCSGALERESAFESEFCGVASACNFLTHHRFPR